MNQLAFTAKYDTYIQKKILSFSMARLLLLAAILLTTIFLKQEVLGAATISMIYAALGVSFFISLINSSFWTQTLNIKYFVPSQLLYDLLLTSYLVYLTGVNDSVFLFLYLLNIIFSSIFYQLNGALSVAVLSGLIYSTIYYINIDMDNVNSIYNLAWSELLFLLTALLSGQLMDEIKKQKALLESQKANIARLEFLNNSLLNNIPLGILVVNQEEYTNNINKSALDLLELKEAPAERIKYYELIPELKGILKNWKSIPEKQRLRFHFESEKISHKKFSLQIVDLPQENSIQYILIFQDITKIMELEKKLEHESRLAATGQLAAGIAHEIRNPLASISGSIEMLSTHFPTDNEQDKKLLSIALKETRRLNRLITDFLDFAKPREINLEAVYLKELVLEIIETFSPNIKQNTSVHFNTNIPAEIIVLADKERLKQVLLNLFLNAAEAVKDENVTIRISATIDAGNNIILEIKDDGIGISNENISKIFDPFFTTKSDGTGLGLSTVAKIVKSMKGDIQVLPYSSEGACFQITLLQAESKSMEKTGS